jgi:hypothetical protein
MSRINVKGILIFFVMYEQAIKQYIDLSFNFLRNMLTI